MAAAAPVTNLKVGVYEIPTDRPESDGTLRWDSTTLVLVEVEAGGETGVGYTYADTSTGQLIEGKLKDVVAGLDALATHACWGAMTHALRNLGRLGIAAAAVSAVDNALWDLKGRLLNVPVVQLLGAARESIPIYGSGGFTSYTDAELREQLGGWAADGMAFVKMKIGREPGRDAGRVEAARAAIGDGVELFVDANGAYARKEALAFAERFRSLGVTWFEEPVSSDDLDGLRLIRDRAPPPIEVSAGEYGYTSWYFRRMLEADAVDVLQADATRCCGITGFMLCKRQPCARRSRSRSPRTAAPPCTSIPAVPPFVPGTWSGFTTTPASSRRCSTARRCPRTAGSPPTSRGRAWASTSSMGTRRGSWSNPSGRPTTHGLWRRNPRAAGAGPRRSRRPSRRTPAGVPAAAWSG